MTWDAVHDSRRTFMACLRAQCAPGAAFGPIPAAGLHSDPRLDSAAALLLTLLDSATPVAADGVEASGVVAAVSAVTRSPAVDVGEAEYVLVVGDPAAAIRRARRGDRDRPEAGATIVVVDDVAPAALRLAGPGVSGHRQSALDLSAAARRERELANAAPPCGIDLFLVGHASVVALPRTTMIEGAA